MAQKSDGSTKKKSVARVPAVPAKRTRGGHAPTGTAAGRRAKHEENGATPKGERTRAELLRGGRVIFERDGYIDARVKDIVAEAGVAHGSFYTYFPAKRDLFEALVAEVGHLIIRAVVHSDEDVPGDTIRNLLNANRRYLAVQRANMKLMVLYDQVSTFDPQISRLRIEGRRRHVERVTGTIQRLQERGLADPSINAHTTAGALIAMLNSFAYWSTVEPGEFHDASVAETVTLIWARTLGLGHLVEHHTRPIKSASPARKRAPSTTDGRRKANGQAVR